MVKNVQGVGLESGSNRNYYYRGDAQGVVSVSVNIPSEQNMPNKALHPTKNAVRFRQVSLGSIPLKTF